MAIMSAQARSLGFSLVFASQDIPAMLRQNDKEAKSIIANTSTKVFMRVEETEMTAKLAVDSAGEGFRAQVGAFSGRSGELHKTYDDNMEARIEKVQRINPIDLRALEPGEAYVTWKDKYFKVKVFYAQPEAEYENISELHLRANHFIPIKRPNPEDVQKQTVLPRIAARLLDPRFSHDMERFAKAAREEVVKRAAARQDPLGVDGGEIPATAVTLLRANPKGIKGSPTDILTASCAAIAAVVLGAGKQAEKFGAEVKRVDLGAVIARSGKQRAGSEIPTRADPAAIHDGLLSEQPPAATGLARDEAEFEDNAVEFAERRGERPPTPVDDPAAIADGLAAASAPTLMRPVEHGITVDKDVFKLAEKIQNNDATLRMLAALDFDGDQPEGEVDNRIERAIGDGDEPVPAREEAPEPAEIERADVASAKATQWPEGTKKSRDPITDLDEAARSGDAKSATAAFLADLLEAQE